MPDYPANLPLYDKQGYAGVIDEGVLRTSFQVTSPNQVRLHNSPREDITMTWHMDNDTFKTWIAWIEANAYDWFNMPVISSRQPTDITSTQLVRFTSEVTTAKRGDNWMSATVSIELQPRVIT